MLGVGSGREAREGVLRANSLVVSYSLDLMDCSPPRSSGGGILQARMLEWVAMFSSRGSSWPRDQTCVSRMCRRVLYH